QGPPTRLRAKPAVRRIAEQFRRVERRKIRSGVIVITLKRCPCRIDDECRQTTENHQRLNPPRVEACGLTNGSRLQRRCCVSSHGSTSASVYRKSEPYCSHANDALARVQTGLAADGTDYADGTLFAELASLAAKMFVSSA